MSYIHEALIKAQKERNGLNPADSAHVAESLHMSTKTSWITLTLLLMLISILIAIIFYSWFRTLQKENLYQVSDIQQNNTKEQPKPKAVAQVTQHQTRSLKPETKVDTPETVVISTPHAETEQNIYPVEEQQDIEKNQPLAPDQFLEVSRFYEKGLQNQVKKKYDAAIAYYEKCLKISPHMAPALNNMGVILLKKKEYHSARQYFLTAIKESPDYVDPYYNLACLYSQIKEFNQAIEYLKMAVNISEEARNWAITDRDFEPLYELKAFNMIISGYKL